MNTNDHGYLTNIGLTPGVLAHDALIAMMVHLLMTDEPMSQEEIDLVDRLLPDRDLRALTDWMARIVAEPLNYLAVGSSLITVESQWYALRFSTHVAARNGRISAPAKEILKGLLAATRLPDTALDKVLTEVLATGCAVISDQVPAVLDAMDWGDVQVAPASESQGDLFEEAPQGAVPVMSLLLDGCEVLSFFQTGFVAVFTQGTQFVGWDTITEYTRVATLSARLVIHTKDGRTLSLGDGRFDVVTAVLDRLHLPLPDPIAVRPEIEVMQAY